jgi:Cu+-exporting ATPase
MAKSRPRGISTKENYKVGGRSSKLAKAVFSVDGMTCSPSAGAIEEALRRLPGIREAVLDLLNNKVQVLYYPSSINVSLNYRHNCY